MANPNLAIQAERKAIIDVIKSAENVQRKKKALADFEIFNDNAYGFVYEKLCKQLSVETANQMPIVSNLNLAKAVVEKEATVYADCPDRHYTSISDNDESVLEKLYEEMAFDSVLSKSNKYYKLRNQSFIQILPKNKGLKMRVIQAHNIDVIPDSEDPEIAYAYIINSFDKQAYLRNQADGVNQRIADQDDYKASLERYQMWTKDNVFTCDGKGRLVDDVIDNPIKKHSFIDVAATKDMEFFVRIGQALTDFTVDFNCAWSDLMYTSRLQGYSVGVFTGDVNLMPKSVIIGPNKMLMMPKNPDNPDSSLSFDFKSPTPNISASLEAIDGLVNTFLSTRGIDIKSISSKSGGQSFSSALEKLLSMIDQFKATKNDFSLYQSVEQQVHSIVTSYLALLSNSEALDPKYNVSPSITSSVLSVQFKEPTMVETPAEKLANGQTKINLGISDRVMLLADINGVSEEEAQEQLDEIDKRRVERLASLVSEGQPQEQVVNANSETQIQQN
jgi:hypothetical protein